MGVDQLAREEGLDPDEVLAWARRRAEELVSEDVSGDLASLLDGLGEVPSVGTTVPPPPPLAEAEAPGALEAERGAEDGAGPGLTSEPQVDGEPGPEASPRLDPAADMDFPDDLGDDLDEEVPEQLRVAPEEAVAVDEPPPVSEADEAEVDEAEADESEADEAEADDELEELDMDELEELDVDELEVLEDEDDGDDDDDVEGSAGDDVVSAELAGPEPSRTGDTLTGGDIAALTEDHAEGQETERGVESSDEHAEDAAPVRTGDTLTGGQVEAVTEGLGREGDAALLGEDFDLEFDEDE